jgi:transcriptional regulator with XRE-family HTH domain
MITTQTDKRKRESVFTTRLKEEMAVHNITQADIASTLQCSPTLVNDVIHERRNPFSVKDILTLCDVYGFDKLTLLTARAWSLKRVEVPAFATYKQVEQVVSKFMNRD